MLTFAVAETLPTTYRAAAYTAPSASFSEQVAARCWAEAKSEMERGFTVQIAKQPGAVLLTYRDSP